MTSRWLRSVPIFDNIITNDPRGRNHPEIYMTPEFRKHAIGRTGHFCRTYFALIHNNRDVIGHNQRQTHRICPHRGISGWCDNRHSCRNYPVRLCWLCNRVKTDQWNGKRIHRKKNFQLSLTMRAFIKVKPHTCSIHLALKNVTSSKRFCAVS